MIWDYEKILLRRMLLWNLLSLATGAGLCLAGSQFSLGMGISAVAISAVEAAGVVLALRGLDEKFDQHVNLELARQESRRLRFILWPLAGFGILLAGSGAGLIWSQPENSGSFLTGSGWGLAAQGVVLFIFAGLHASGIPKDLFLPELDLFDGPEHTTFTLEGGAPAALLLHGFPDTPLVMRPLAEALHAQGWTVKALLLPGFGKEMPGLFQYRAAEWIAVIEQEVRRLKTRHSPVLLAGFSMGAGLSIAAARNSQPDGLVLLAPFWWREPFLLRSAVSLLRLFLPPSLRLLRWSIYLTTDTQDAVHILTPGLDLDDPDTRHKMASLRIPLDFLEQFRRMGRYTQRAAPFLNMPALVVRGGADQLVNPHTTRRLVNLLPGMVTYIEVIGGHTLTLREHEDFVSVQRAVLEFTRKFLDRPS